MLNPYLLDDLNIHEDVIVKSRFLDDMKRLTQALTVHTIGLWLNFKDLGSVEEHLPICL